ncbi:hypothetical protein [Peribacillus frigoritolerans]|uniref:hypothetical protein n=1 Tax=Peribacillus frigoritolerans TaxID=450367 RepID=UPI0020C13DE8|nr:hypothetical protein [Peribacillus frigoritolerans]
MTNKKASLELAKIYVEELWEEHPQTHCIFENKEHYMKTMMRRAKRTDWISEKDAELALKRSVVSPFTAFEKSLSKEEHKKMNRSIENFRKELIEEGYDSNFLTKMELLAAVTVIDARVPFLELKKRLKGHASAHKLLNFKQMIITGVTTQSNISAKVLDEAIESVKDKGIFGKLNLVTGLTGELEYDFV